MTNAKQNAINLYMEGIRDGNFSEAIHQYSGERYTQHSGGVGDGQAGFIAFFESFVQRNPVRDINIVRALADGQYVFVHVYQSLNSGEAQWVTMDIFDSNMDGKIIEHWDVICAYDGETASGHTMIDGETTVTDLEKTEANKALMRLFLTDVLQNRNYDNIDTYIASDKFVQHNPCLADGVDAYADYLKSNQPTLEFVRLVMGEGNFVATLSKVVEGDTEKAVMDLWRLDDNRIVEHWDSIETIAPRDEWANSGKF